MGTVKELIMLTERDKETLIAASTVLRIEGRWYYDAYRRESDGMGNRSIKKAKDAYERYKELGKLADELDVIATGNL